jgi:hypothetical protein
MFTCGGTMNESAALGPSTCHGWNDRRESGMRFALSAVLVWTVGCCENSGDPTFSCEPLPSNTPGCVGGPRWSEDGKTHQAAPDAIFPAPCRATVPSCDSDDGYRTFECHESDGVFGWIEPV